MGGLLFKDFFPSGMADSNKHTKDSHWVLWSESPIIISLLSLKISNKFIASNLQVIEI